MTALDITKIEQVLSLVRAEQPEVIINCAAHTNVDACEKQWDAAYRINALGPRNLSIAAEAVGAKMIHVSTDYVFEGNGTKPYTEFDAPNPVSAYGKTKLEGEKFVQQFSNHFFIFRTAWLYGDGKNFVKTMLNLSETHDEVSGCLRSAWIANKCSRACKGNPSFLRERKIMVCIMLLAREIQTGQTLQRKFSKEQEKAQR